MRQEFSQKMNLDWKVMKKGGISNNGAFADACWENLPMFHEITQFPLHILEKYNNLQIVMRGSDTLSCSASQYASLYVNIGKSISVRGMPVTF